MRRFNSLLLGVQGVHFLLQASALGLDFGARRFINGAPKNHHTGIDIKAPAGTPIAAPSDGRVLYTGRFSLSGNSVFIDHGTGICSMYFHLASFAVHSGQKVKRGDIIGTVGSTGRSTGPHLHWGVRINNKRVDPLALKGSYAGAMGMGQFIPSSFRTCASTPRV